MTTTTATTATNVGQSILNSLSATSGVDTASLVASLVQAQFASKNLQLTNQESALTAQISSVAKVQSGITSFASGLKTLIKGGSLVTQPTSSDASVLTAAALPGAKLSGLTAQVEVTRLATAQIATSANVFASRSAVVGTGTLTLTLGTATVENGQQTAFTAGTAAPVTIAIDSGSQTLDGIARAINAAATGVSASIVTDSDGKARLTLKGQTGAAQAFTLSGDSDGLAALNVGVGQGATTIGAAAGNAQLKVDGVAVERASNTVSDLIDGVKLNLVGASVGKPVTLGSSTPTAGLSQAVSDFVETYNQMQAVLKQETNATDGPLRNDYTATGLARALSGLTLTNLTTGAPSGAPTTLSAIGVSTNRDGTLSVDNAKLAAALAKNPQAVEAMFADGTGASGNGIGGALDAISSNAVSKTVKINGRSETLGLVGSAALYTARKQKVTDAEEQVTKDTATYQERLTRQYAASDARVAAYKAAQTQLQNQIDQWNKSTG